MTWCGNGWPLIPAYQPRVSWVFLRGLGLIYLAAFASLAVQIQGLIGADGILPIAAKLQQFSGAGKYWFFPTLFWLDASDRALQLACYAGMAAAALLVLDVFTRAALIGCFLLYLSLATAGQDFTAFQWDVFLPEAGFLAIFLTWGSGIIIFLYRWLIARFMFMGGVVKLASGDPSWANLSALDYHYLTQPLPAPLAYYAYYLPDWFNRLCVAGVFFIELVVPFFVFFPRRWRLFAAWSFILLQCSIIATGNYGFFNLLTILICLFLFEDRDLEKILPEKLSARITSRQPVAGKTASVLAGCWAFLVLFVAATHFWMSQSHRRPVVPVYTMIKTVAAFSVINNYGPFTVMTTTRPEIIVEGSSDGEHWQEYSFRYKPDRLDKPLRHNIPHQPRLDWQLWFAALAAPEKPLWLNSFLERLRQGSPSVLALLGHNPFPGNPPRFVRLRLYRYDYTTRERRAASGRIWRRLPLYIY